MIHAILHAVTFFYFSTWSNIFAPSFFSLLGIALSHWRLRKHHDRRHAEVMHHLRKGSP